MQPEISIVIPTYNRKLRLRDTLESLSRQSIETHRYEIIVVDDGSDDGTAEMVAGYTKVISTTIRYIYQSRGQAGLARNKGIIAARAPIVLLMDSDILVKSDHIKLHLDLHGRYTDLQIAVLGRIMPEENGFELIRRSDLDQAAIGHLAGGELVIKELCFVTADVSIKKRFIIEAGLFTPGLPVIEDMDLALRLQARGLRLIYCREAIAFHTEPLDSVEKVVLFGKKYGSAFAEWYGRLPLYDTEIWRLGGRFNGGWRHFRVSPLGYAKDALRRWAINRWTIGFLLRWARNIPISNPPSSILSRLCKEIWAYYYRSEFHARVCRSRKSD